MTTAVSRHFLLPWPMIVWLIVVVVVVAAAVIAADVVLWKIDHDNFVQIVR